MAKAQGPLHSDHVKGSYSGLTFREYRGLPTISRKLRPVERNTVPQSNNRSILGYLSRNWQLLTPAEQLSWRAWGQNNPVNDGFGGTFQLDGMQSYIKLMTTTIRLFGWAGVYTTAPLVEPAATCDTLVVAPGGAAGELDCNFTVLGIGSALDVIEIQVAGPFMSEARVSIQSKYAYNDQVVGNLTTIVLSGLMTDAWYWIRVRYVDQWGQVTNFVPGQSQAG